MSDDDALRRLLSDAADEIRPHDRWAEIRASVHPDPRAVGSPRRPRPWLYAVSGAVASAAVIGVIAFAADQLSGPDGPDTLVAADGSTLSPAATTATATDPSAPESSPSTDSSPTAGVGPEAYAVYYVGEGGDGKPVLFRETHRGPTLPASDPAGSGDDILTEAVSDAMNALPADPDYRTPWRGLARLDYASYAGTGAGMTLQIALDASSATTRPTDMTPAEARAAVQQLVYTAQSAIGKRAPVTFTIGRKPSGPHPTLLGVDISRPIAGSPPLSTLSLVNILSPTEGAAVAGKLVVSGLNSSVEGNVVVYLEHNGRKYLKRPVVGGTGPHRLHPWHTTFDLTRIQPGEYSIVAVNGDPSGAGGRDTDTRTIEVK